MKDTLTSRNHHDFARRYAGSFGWLLKDDGSKVLVSIANATQREVTFSTKSGTAFFAKVDAKVNFEFIPVDKGWYNTVDHQVVFMERVPARQWKRGINVENTLIYNIDNMSYGQSITYELLSNIFVDKFDNWGYFPGQDLKFPRALSKYFAIDAKNRFYFLNQIVGNIKDNEIVLNDDFILQEVQDLIARKRYPFTVKVSK